MERRLPPLMPLLSQRAKKVCQMPELHGERVGTPRIFHLSRVQTHAGCGESTDRRQRHAPVLRGHKFQLFPENCTASVSAPSGSVPARLPGPCNLSPSYWSSRPFDPAAMPTAGFMRLRSDFTTEPDPPRLVEPMQLPALAESTLPASVGLTAGRPCRSFQTPPDHHTGFVLSAGNSLRALVSADRLHFVAPAGGDSRKRAAEGGRGCGPLHRGEAKPYWRAVESAVPSRRQRKRVARGAARPSFLRTVGPPSHGARLARQHYARNCVPQHEKAAGPYEPAAEARYMSSEPHMGCGGNRVAEIWFLPMGKENGGWQG